MYSAADRKDIRRAEKSAKAIQSEDMDFVRDAMSTTRGRAWFWRKLVACHIKHTSFTGDALTSAFREGERNIGLMVEADIQQACPELYLLMVQEANTREMIYERSTDTGTVDEPADGEYA